MNYLRNTRGSITPSFVIIVMLMMLTGSYFFSLMKVYENRLIVRDAVDSAVTSALASGAVTRTKPVYYYEELVCVRSHTEVDSDTGETYVVCDAYDWVTRESNHQNYICIRPAAAEQEAKKFLELNLKNNSKDCKLKNFAMTIHYDKGRPLLVESARYNTSAPHSWWFSEFGDSGPPALTAVSTRQVRFPRWAKVYVEATVEIKIPFGNLLGTDTMEFTWKADAVKELKEVSN